MIDLTQKVNELEAQLITLNKRIADVVQQNPVSISTEPFHADYKHYDGPFMMGFPSGSTVKIGPGYVMAQEGAYYWAGGTGGLSFSTNYITLDITMDGETVDSAAVGCYSTLAAVTSTPGLRKVLIGTAQRTTVGTSSKATGRTQEQRGNIILSACSQPVLDIIVTDARAPSYTDYSEMAVGYDPLYATIVQRYTHAATYEVNSSSSPYGVKNTIKFLDPDSMYKITVTGCFKKVSGTADGDMDRPEIVLCKGASAAGSVASDIIHALTQRSGVFIEVPPVYGYSSSPEPAPDSPDVYVPGVGEFIENWSITTLIVPTNDLTDDTLSIWGKAIRSADYEIVIKRIWALYDVE